MHLNISQNMLDKDEKQLRFTTTPYELQVSYHIPYCSKVHFWF
jgi:hypothetical protein